MTNNIDYNRMQYLDTTSGILLLHMICYHCWQWAELPPNAIWLRILSFFMPWFFFKSGMFYKNQSADKVIKKCFRKLIIPFLIFSIIGEIFDIIRILSIGAQWDIISGIKTIIGSLLKTGAIFGNYPLWFLPSLFAVRIIYNCLNMRKKHECLWLLLIIPIVLFYTVKIAHIELPYYLYNVPTGLMFYMLGDKLRHIRLSNITLISIVTLYLISVVFCPQMVDMRSNKLLSGTYIGWIFMSVLGIMSINEICLRYFNNQNIFSKIGNKSMPIYCWHWIIILIVSILIRFSVLTKVQYFMVEVSFMIICLPLFVRLQRRLGF